MSLPHTFFAGRSLKGGNPRDDVFPVFSGWGAGDPVGNFSKVARVSLNLSGSSAGKVIMEPGGQRLWIAEYGGQDVHEYTLSTPYMISSITKTGAQGTYPELDTTFAVNPQGDTVIVGARGGAYVYTLSTPWDLTGAKTQIAGPYGTSGSRDHWASFGDQEKFFAIYSDGADYLATFENFTTGDYSTAQLYSQTTWLPNGSDPTNSYGGQFSPDGLGFALTEYGDNSIHFWEMSSPWITGGLSNLRSFNLDSITEGSGSMGLQLVRLGSQGYAYLNDPYDYGFLTQLSFTWNI
jgi:hypothetical protein